VDCLVNSALIHGTDVEFQHSQLSLSLIWHSSFLYSYTTFCCTSRLFIKTVLQNRQIEFQFEFQNRAPIAWKVLRYLQFYKVVFSKQVRYATNYSCIEYLTLVLIWLSLYYILILLHIGPISENTFTTEDRSIITRTLELSTYNLNKVPRYLQITKSRFWKLALYATKACYLDSLPPFLIWLACLI